MRGSEAIFSGQVMTYLRRRLVESRWGRDVSVDSRVKILKDFTIGKVGERWRLIAGVQEQDIVFYRSSDSISYSDFKSQAMDDINKYRNRPIHVPLAVVELKVGGEHMNTHELITYSSISAQLKQVFPHCRYCLLMKSNERGFKPSTFLRHGKGFDRVFVGWRTARRPLWDYIDDHLKYLSGSGFVVPADD